MAEQTLSEFAVIVQRPGGWWLLVLFLLALGHLLYVVFDRGPSIRIVTGVDRREADRRHMEGR